MFYVQHVMFQRLVERVPDADGPIVPAAPRSAKWGTLWRTGRGAQRRGRRGTLPRSAWICFLEDHYVA